MELDPVIDREMQTTTRAPRGRRPWLPLLAAVMQLAGGKAELLRHTESAWASVTFSGSRHRIALAFRGAGAVAAGEDFIAALPEHEFRLPRILVADAAILGVEHSLAPEPRLEVEIELLLVDEDQ